MRGMTTAASRHMSMTTMRALHARLRQEHAELDAALDQLIQAFETGDQVIARTAFRAFDRRLSQHLRIEDDLLLPDFANVDRVEAELLASEHRTIRAKADELAIGGDLHAARLPVLRELVDLLRSHAKREDAMLYRWVEESLAADEETVSSAIEARQPVVPR